MSNLVSNKSIQHFFFRGMRAGWAASAEKTTMLGMPNYKALAFEEGPFRLMDFYCVTPEGPCSAGTTTIWYRNVPVWVMQYKGYYMESAIEFLKKVLNDTYVLEYFYGGRGPKWFGDGPLEYTNKPIPNYFNKFQGREEIRNIVSGKTLGYHEYSGMVL